MSESILSQIHGPEDLCVLKTSQLSSLAGEIREELCRLSDHRAVHFASNLGVVELSIALHSVFDFSKDRLLWDTGHQCYPHKILTGRFDKLHTIRTKGGLMGFPNPAESPYDLMMTGHAGCSIGTVLGLSCGDELNGRSDRHSVAVIGDGAFSSGVVFESMNHIGWLKKNLTVILNDNKMSICPRVGGLALYLDRLRMMPSYLGLKQSVHQFLNHVPLFKHSTESFLGHLKAAIKAGLLGGMLFEELGFRYIGPIDGHNIEQLQNMFRLVRNYEEPVLLHVFTEKGRGYIPAELDPTTYHAPSPEVMKNGTKSVGNREWEAESGKGKDHPDSTTPHSVHPAPPFPENDGDCEPNEPSSYTFWVREAILREMRRNEKVCVITAAMCQGNMLEPVRDEFPTRFFDVGICESHAVVFAAGLAKAGMLPIVNIYSTFLQRGYDQIFQEISLQNLPVVFLMDRAGLSGPDGPTHHGVFDIPILRPFPNLVLMSPGDPTDVGAMLEFVFNGEKDSCANTFPVAIRYPKSTASPIPREFLPVEAGKAEVLSCGKDGTLVVYGGLLETALAAAITLRVEDSLDFGVINARFAKPIDADTIFAQLEGGKPLVTVEEGMLAGGFGSAVLEAAADRRLETCNIYRLGIPDRYVQHAERGELLAELGLDEPGIVAFCREIKRRIVSLHY